MNMIYVSTGMLLAFPLLVPAAYVVVYGALRVWGKLNVSQGGWQASSIGLGGTVLVTAIRLFAMFTSLMCWESRLRRLVGGTAAQDDKVSEVVVDVVRIA